MILLTTLLLSRSPRIAYAALAKQPNGHLAYSVCIADSDGRVAKTLMRTGWACTDVAWTSPHTIVWVVHEKADRLVAASEPDWKPETLWKDSMIQVFHAEVPADDPPGAITVLLHHTDELSIDGTRIKRVKMGNEEYPDTSLAVRKFRFPGLQTITWNRGDPSENMTTNKLFVTFHYGKRIERFPVNGEFYNLYRGFHPGTSILTTLNPSTSVYEIDWRRRTIRTFVEWAAEFDFNPNSPICSWRGGSDADDELFERGMVGDLSTWRKSELLPGSKINSVCVSPTLTAREFIRYWNPPYSVVDQ
jgi:hypothetical protein